MEQFKLVGTDISKAFSRNREIFKGINLNLQNTEILGVTGPNGSGKSTLLKILSGVSKPSKGSVEFFLNDTIQKKENLYEHIGFVSPYLNIYEEFSPLEHCRIADKLAGTKYNETKCIELLKMFKLETKRNEPIRTFSSGMKQRVKYILALQKESEILFLDEPMTNLDTAGVELVNKLIIEQKSLGGAVIIATNDEREKSFCEKFIEIDKHQ